MASSPEEATTRASHPQPEHLLGVVERVTFHSEESGYTVARFNVPGERELVTIIGRFPEIHAGQTLRLTGFWREHPKYGRQFQKRFWDTFGGSAIWPSITSRHNGRWRTHVYG